MPTTTLIYSLNETKLTESNTYSPMLTAKLVPSITEAKLPSSNTYSPESITTKRGISVTTSKYIIVISSSTTVNFTVMTPTSVINTEIASSGISFYDLIPTEKSTKIVTPNITINNNMNHSTDIEMDMAVINTTAVTGVVTLTTASNPTKDKHSTISMIYSSTLISLHVSSAIKDTNSEASIHYLQFLVVEHMIFILVKIVISFNVMPRYVDGAITCVHCTQLTYDKA